MNVPGRFIFESIISGYADNPVLRAFIALLPAAFQNDLPSAALIVPAADAALVTALQQYRIRKQKILHDSLNDGSIILDEDAISNDNFIHSYLQTVQYVERARTEEKVERFAQILKALFKSKININQFEYYTKVLDELTEREFALLAMKSKFEDDYSESNSLNDYWEKFAEVACTELEIDMEQLNYLFTRLNGSGCYYIRISYGAPSYAAGNTTKLFKEIRQTIS